VLDLADHPTVRRERPVFLARHVHGTSSPADGRTSDPPRTKVPNLVSFDRLFRMRAAGRDVLALAVLALVIATAAAVGTYLGAWAAEVRAHERRSARRLAPSARPLVRAAPMEHREAASRKREGGRRPSPSPNLPDLSLAST